MYLTQNEIDNLLNMLKKVKYEKDYFNFPEKGSKAMLDVLSLDGKTKFIIDIKPGSKRSNNKKITYQERYSKDTILLRLDIASPYHTNPDGEKISGNHLHIIREGEDDKYAIEVPEEFVNIDDKVETLINFLEYCKVQNPDFAYMERNMLL